MAELDKKRNTDVPGSIAGYYYQILLACREISRYGDIEEVGVETGADVNVISKSKGIMNIEAKFHQDNFGRYAEDIVKTIYNFYTGYDKSIKEFVFSTNSSPNKECRKFFENWGKNGDEERYIKKCILMKSVQGPCKAKYEKFCKNPKIQAKKAALDKKEIDLLVEETLDGKGQFLYEDYAVENSEISYAEFIGLMKFSFAGKKKQEMISEIRKEIKSNIEKTLIKLGKKSLESDETDLIINEMIDHFLEIISFNSEDNTRTKRFTSSDYIRILNNYDTIEEKHISKYQIFSCIQAMQEEEENVIEEIQTCASVIDRDKMKDNYLCVQRKVLNMLAEPDGYQAFVQAYQLKPNKNVGVASIVVKIVYALSIMMTKENLSLEDVELILTESTNNIRLRDFLQCAYKKSFSSAYRHMRRIVAELICKYQEETHIDENQIFVVDADYKNNGMPCQVKELKPEVYSITETDENYNDYLLFCHMNYKCTKCLDINDDAGYRRFKYGGGNLCKRI